MKLANLIGKNACGGNSGIMTFICIEVLGHTFVEKRSLLESLEVKRQPRLKLPFPARAGLYGCPTTVANVETITPVAPTIIIRKGASWFNSLG